MNCETCGRDALIFNKVRLSGCSINLHLSPVGKCFPCSPANFHRHPTVDPDFGDRFHGFSTFPHAQDVPQIQYVDKIVEVPVQKQRHVPVIQKVPKIVEVPTLEFVDHVVHVPITQHRHVPVLQTVKKHVEVPVVKYEVGVKTSILWMFTVNVYLY